MGWLGGWFGGGDSSDPLKNLDPKLREFLDKEAPAKYTPDTSKPAAQPPPTAPIPPPKSSESPSPETSEDSKPAVPSASLYKDGRYAHLWKNYRPLAEVENETKSDHEKMMDLLQDYKARKNAIGRGALENCAEEQADWASCMKDGGIGDRFTMCAKEVRKFERCYMVQSKLLTALGYLSTTTARNPENDERIQMHADTLYHRMLEREAAVEKAKAEGLPIPTFGPLSQTPAQSAAAAAIAEATGSASQPQTESTTRTYAKDDILSIHLGTGDKKKKWDEKLAKLPPEEAHAEEQALRGELRAKQELANKMEAMWDERKAERRERLEKGEARITDRVAQLFGKA